ncbi:nucleophosmin-like isoform X2 [Carcharodon carcharias]|nr:nucleophosmin-like isoform X2 [Carcharodon carcharias]
MEVDDDESEHQLSLRTVCLGAGASDDLHLVEAEGLNSEGKNMKITLAALKLSVQPTVSLGGFEITPPVTFRLKSGAGPVYISGQHLIALDDEDLDSDEDDLESDDDDSSMMKNTLPKQALKRPAAGPSKIMQKKMKVEDSEDDEEDDDAEEEDEDEEDMTPAKKPLQKTPLKATPGSKGTPNQNGKTSTKSTPADKQPKTPESSSKPKTPKTPKTSMTVEEIKAKLKTSVEKGVGMPKLEPKFINYLKHGFRIEDPKIIKELWAWRQNMDGK